MRVELPKSSSVYLRVHRFTENYYQIISTYTMQPVTLLLYIVQQYPSALLSIVYIP